MVEMEIEQTSEDALIDRDGDIFSPFLPIIDVYGAMHQVHANEAGHMDFINLY